MRDRIRFRISDAPEGRALRQWHRELLTQPRRGERARLRRAGTIEEAAMAPGFHRLLRHLELRPSDSASSLPPPRQLSALAAVAALAATIGQDDRGTRLGKTLGRPRTGSSAPRVSDARFRRLLASSELDERFTILRRLVPLLESADLAELGGALCDWTPERRRRLAYDYYATAPEPEETPS